MTMARRVVSSGRVTGTSTYPRKEREVLKAAAFFA